MKVEYPLGYSYISQTIRRYSDGTTWYRVGYPDTNTWSDWVQRITNNDLDARFNPIRLNGSDGGTFSSVLKDKSNNAVKFIAFSSSPSDNPFSFVAGYAIVFHSGLLMNSNILTMIGVSYDNKPIIEARRITL